MKVKQSEVKKITITELENLDPITVYTEEWQDEKRSKPDDPYYQGRVTIIFWDTALTYFWCAMAKPLKEFFINASPSYISDKLLQQSSKKIDKERLHELINAVKDAFRELLKKDKSESGNI